MNQPGVSIKKAALQVELLEVEQKSSFCPK
jgi:hypothetical protein